VLAAWDVSSTVFVECWPEIGTKRAGALRLARARAVAGVRAGGCSSCALGLVCATLPTAGP
jgi:hypothetical protein